MSPEFSEPDEAITSHDILQEMIGDAIGLDNPMTDASIAAGSEVVQTRLDNAKAWLDWKPGDPDLDPATHDTQAMAALILSMIEEKSM